jgi:hypothetical protein
MHLGEAVAPRELLSPANWPADRGAVSRVDWSRDGDTVYFNVFDASEAVSYWAIPAVGGHPRLLARFEHEPIYQEFALRDDRLYFTIDNRGSDIKLIEVDQIRR